MIKIGRKECLILIIGVILPAVGYGLSYFIFRYSWRGMILLTTIGLLAAAFLLVIAMWMIKKKNQPS